MTCDYRMVQHILQIKDFLWEEVLRQIQEKGKHLLYNQETTPLSVPGSISSGMK